MWERKGKKRGPLREKFSIGSAQMMLSVRMRDKVPNETADYYQKRLASKILFALQSGKF
jgi:hypothetical protein